MTRRSPGNGGLGLPQHLALSLFLVPLLIAFGAYFSEIVESYRKYLQPLDPWNKDTSHWRKGISGVLLVYTGMMFLKQWGYYFVRGQGKGGFFTDTCGAFNDAEWALDIAMSLWGGILVLTAWGMPSFWLPCVAVYFFLVFLRCRLALRRSRLAEKWTRLGQAAGPNYLTLWSSFPRKQIVSLAKAAGMIDGSRPDSWEDRLAVLRESLDWTHSTAIVEGPDGKQRPLMAKEILTGWDWVDRLYAALALLFSVLAWIVTILVGTGPVSFLVIVILGGSIFALFLYLGHASKDYGINNWHRFVR